MRIFLAIWMISWMVLIVYGLFGTLYVAAVGKKHPARRRLMLFVGYSALTIAVLFWLVTFTLPAFTLYFYDGFPADLIHRDSHQISLPKFSMMLFCLAMTLLGIPMLYFTLKRFREIHRLR